METVLRELLSGYFEYFVACALRIP